MAAIIETKENEKDGLLKTHYYKTSYDEMKDVYLHFLEDQGYRVVSIEDGYNEIFAEIPHMTVTAKIIEQTPRETSIDFISARSSYSVIPKRTVVHSASVPRIGKTF